MPKSRIPLPSIKTVLIVIVVITYTVTFTFLLGAILSSSHNEGMSSFGHIYMLGYDAHDGDIVIVNGNKTLNWGSVYIGSTTNRSFYLKSKSNVVTEPQLYYGNWTFKNAQEQQQPLPSLNNITCNWNLKNNTRFEPNQDTFITITLSVEYNPTFVEELIKYNTTTFSFDISIFPSQV